MLGWMLGCAAPRSRRLWGHAAAHNAEPPRMDCALWFSRIAVGMIGLPAAGWLIWLAAKAVQPSTRVPSPGRPEVAAASRDVILSQHCSQ